MPRLFEELQIVGVGVGGITPINHVWEFVRPSVWATAGRFMSCKQSFSFYQIWILSNLFVIDNKLTVPLLSMAQNMLTNQNKNQKFSIQS